MPVLTSVDDLVAYLDDQYKQSNDRLTATTRESARRFERGALYGLDLARKAARAIQEHSK